MPSRTRVSPLFVLAAVSGALFCVTTLSLVVLPWMEARTPFLDWLDRNGLPLIASEVVATLLAGGAALLFDAPARLEPPNLNRHEPNPPAGD